MNQIARRSANGTASAISTPAALRVPQLPASVANHMHALDAHAKARAAFYAAAPEDRERMFVGPMPALRPLHQHERDTAETALRAMAEDLAPISLEAFGAWLGPVNAAVRNPQGQEDLRVRTLGLHALCSDLPHGAFTAAARRDLPEFFPGAADIRRVVEPGSRRLRAAQAALTAALEAKRQEPEPEEQRRPLTDAEKAANAAKVAALKADLAAQITKDAPKATPRYLTPDQLRASYEALAAEGNKAAAARLETLR